MNLAGNIKCFISFCKQGFQRFLTAVRLSKSVTFSISQMMFFLRNGQLGALYEKLLFFVQSRAACLPLGGVIRSGSDKKWTTTYPSPAFPQTIICKVKLDNKIFLFLAHSH